MSKIKDLAISFSKVSARIPGPNSPKSEAKVFANFLAKQGINYVNSAYGLDPSDFHFFVFPKKGENEIEWSYQVVFMTKSVLSNIKEDFKGITNSSTQDRVRDYLSSKYGHLVKIV